MWNLFLSLDYSQMLSLGRNGGLVYCFVISIFDVYIYIYSALCIYIRLV